MRFDVYKLPNGGAGYVVDVQSDFLSNLPTRIVTPLISADRYKNPIRDLHPTFEIADKPFILMTHETASLPKKLLGKPIVSLFSAQERINRALDLLLTGF